MAKGAKGSGGLCSIEGCDKPHKAKGLCLNHYQRLRKYGTTDKIVGTEAYRDKLRAVRAKLKSEVSLLDDHRDTRPGQKGFLANKIVSQIRADAIKHGVEWDLTSVETFHLIMADCSYCGKPSNWPETRNGIDRVDSAVGYNLQNCVSSCFKCNAAKGSGSVTDFMEWAKRLAKYNGF